MPLPVVFILSSNYSGSHLLASALGAHSACADVGEVANLRKFLARSERPLSGTRGRFATSPLFDGLPELPEGRWLCEIHERLAVSGRPAAVLVDNSKRIEWVEQAIAGGAIEPRLVHLIGILVRSLVVGATLSGRREPRDVSAGGKRSAVRGGP